ncbi:hypothetical protein BBP40_006936 [Aspergillus hancockii]|nr:hypothetical protein BBP40_006936 [Aspergillus hancockii]
MKKWRSSRRRRRDRGTCLLLVTPSKLTDTRKYLAPGQEKWKLDGVRYFFWPQPPLTRVVIIGHILAGLLLKARDACALWILTVDEGVSES